eukprot:scaffold141527_cov40-Prasinocladus_malaysianus.AAC.1
MANTDRKAADYYMAKNSSYYAYSSESDQSARILPYIFLDWFKAHSLIVKSILAVCNALSHEQGNKDKHLLLIPMRQTSQENRDAMPFDLLHNLP